MGRNSNSAPPPTSASPLRVLLISRCPPYPLHLGDRLIVYHLARELSERGHTIDLLAFDDGSADDDSDVYGAFFRHITVLPDPERSPVDYVRRLVMPSARFPQAANQAWSPDMWRAIREHVMNDQYDIAHLFGGIQVYEYLHAVKPLPVMITPYESYSLYLRRQVEAGAGWGARAQWFAAREYERWMFAPYPRVIVLTDRDRDELRTLDPMLRLSVIPNGVDLGHFIPPYSDSPREPNTILFTGNFGYPPNLDAALFLANEILPRVQSRIPAARLWLVGANPPPELLALADDTITVSGQVADMRPYFARASVFASALRMGAGIKNKVLEAMAMGCPMVATPLSLDGINAKHGDAVLISAPDAKTIAGAITRVLGDPDLSARLRRNARLLIEREYNWTTIAGRYETLYREVIG